ncbi:hypothetical protein MRB53_001163 [Persea americana]|uniref:Uncharacterized protein n=1 Tax=Persea americana TaxID=3435 RepID=A0ACC2MRS3_PERAE|nr:hypothetical protein MRB53_001163 [Persea americana]
MVAHLPSHLWQAVVACEDNRFFRHFGIDPIGVSRAILLFPDGGGGSTITQQLVKNVFLKHERKFSRKIYWGHGVYGIEAASAFYFGKRPSVLTLAESAMQAGIIPSPEHRSPFREPSRGKISQAKALRKMVDAGLLDIDSAMLLLKQPLCLRVEDPKPEDRPSFSQRLKSEEVEGSADQRGKISSATEIWDWEKASACFFLQENFMGSTHNVSLHLSSHTAMAMQGQEEEIKVRVRYHVKERKTWTVPFVHGEAISFVELERVVSNSQVDFSPSINSLLSPEASASFVLHTLSLMDNIPRVSVQDLTTPIAKHAYNKARNALERGCNTLLLTFTMEIIEEQSLPDRGELENLNEQTGLGVVPATDDEIGALKTNIFKELENKYLDCNICLEEFVEDTQVKQMPCLHVFHGPCIVEWLKLCNSCPICRSSLPHVS